MILYSVRLGIEIAISCVIFLFLLLTLINYVRHAQFLRVFLFSLSLFNYDQTTFDVNVIGTISLTRLLAPFMLQRGRGHFVVVSGKSLILLILCHCLLNLDSLHLNLIDNNHISVVGPWIYYCDITVTVYCQFDLQVVT